MLNAPEKPRLKRHVRLRLDEMTGHTFVLYPEMGLLLNASGIRILQLCEEGRTFLEITAILADESQSPSDTVARDVRAFLLELFQRGLLDGINP